MPSQPTLDFDALLAPIEGDNPAGADPKADMSPSSLHLKLKDARSQARAAERRAESDESEGMPPEWRTVVSVATEMLSSGSKDLDAATCLTEALVRLEGFAGLRDGLKLLRGLIQEFWDGIYPLEDEDGMETRIAPVVGMLGEGRNSPLCLALRKVHLTQGYDPGPFAAWHYDMAMEVEKIADEEKRERRLKAGAPTLSDFNTSFAQSSRSFIRNLVDDLDEAITELNGLSDDLSDRCGSEAPSVSSVRDVLEQILGLVRHLGADLLADEGTAAGSDPQPMAESGPQTAAGGKTVAVSVGPIASRDQAFKMLLDVAEFFRKTEPQSFLPLMLENVVRRGRMSMLDLLMDLVPDDDARRALYLRAGVTMGND